MVSDRAKHRKGLRNFGKGVVLNVTKEGKITYPTLTEEESKDENALFLADRKIELRFAEKRIEKIEIERHFNYEQSMKIVERERKIEPLFTEVEREIARAYIEYPKWKKRLQYLRGKGIKKDRPACNYIINKLKKAGTWEILCQEVQESDY